MESADVETEKSEPQQEMGSTTCCACPVCTCGVNCACRPKSEGAGCDPCAAFMKEAASSAAISEDPTDQTPQPEASAADESQQEVVVGSTTCCACPVCTCGPSCSCPKGEGAGCDPCAAFMKEAASSAAAAAVPEDPSLADETSGQEARTEVPSASPTTPLSQGGGIMNDPDAAPSSGTPSSAAAMSSAAAGAASLTPEEQKAVRKERRDRAREAKLTQTKIRDKSAHRQRNNGGSGGGGGGGGSNKRRWGTGRRGKGKNKGGGGGAGADSGSGGASREDKATDVFDEWLGVKLIAWKEGGEKGTNRAEGGLAMASPPEESGVTEEIDFDPSKDEIGKHVIWHLQCFWCRWQECSLAFHAA